MKTFTGAGVRYFGDKPYHFVDSYSSKSEANQKVSRIRERGGLARVVRTMADRRYTRYLVYKRG